MLTARPHNFCMLVHAVEDLFSHNASQICVGALSHKIFIQEIKVPVQTEMGVTTDVMNKCFTKNCSYN